MDPALRRLPLGEADRRRLEPLMARGWTLPGGREHPLGRLQGKRVGPYRFLLLLGPRNSVGARYFQLYLVDGEGRLSDEPVAFGLHNSGPFPGYNWIDLIRYQGRPAFRGQALDLAARGLDRRLLRLLSALVPPGGHLMVEYESPSQGESARILGQGLPAAASPLGYLLLLAGCLSFRDWYIPEGGREGPRKLQGFKPLSDELARERAQALRRELEALLSRPLGRGARPWERTVRRLARAALRALDRGQAGGGRGPRGGAGSP